MTNKVNHFTPSTKVGKTFTHIPKNIFQTYATNELSDGAYEAVNSWQTLNPSWNHYFFTDEEQREFIQQYFNEDVLWAYDQLIPGAYKADLWRYCVLYIEGGIYADHKLILNHPLDHLLPDDIQFATFKDKSTSFQRRYSRHGYLWQAFIISPKNCPLLKKAINDIVLNVQLGNYCVDTLSITGPGLLGRAFAELLTESNTEQISNYHLFDNPFTKKSFNPVIFDKNNVMTMYHSYHHERNHKTFSPKDFGQTDYLSSWFLGNVYKHGKCVRDKTDLSYKPKLRGFYRRHIKKAFKYQQHHYALQLIKTTLKLKRFQPKIWFIWLKYKLLNIHKKSSGQNK